MNLNLLRGILAALAVGGVMIPGGQAVVSQAAADVFGGGANSFQIEFVTIGNPGNPADTKGNPNPAGSVSYAYRIGKYEISEQMIDKANALGGLGITKDVRGPDKPATSVTWFEAARFVNWLNTSTGNAPAYKFDEAGTFRLWLPADPGYNPNNLERNSLAKYFLPGVHEWYKAAYYDPTRGVYYNFPTGSNSVPDGIDAAGDTEFDAVFVDGGGNLQPNDIYNVGVLSPYGTAGQGGNVWEWNEAAFVPSDTLAHFGRSARGGAWSRRSITLWSIVYLVNRNASLDDSTFGFRIASTVPEPSATAMAGAALLVLLSLNRRFGV